MSDVPVEVEPSPEDAELLARLRSVAQRVEPVPAEVSTVARSLLSWRDPDALLAELVADTRELAGVVRGDTAVVLRFQAGGTEIVVQLSPSGEGYRVVGQIQPAAAGTVWIRRMGEQAEVPVDELGRFVAERLTAGPVSLRWRPAGEDEMAVDTAWQLV